MSGQMQGLLLHGRTTQNGQRNGVCNSDMAAPLAAVHAAGEQRASHHSYTTQHKQLLTPNAQLEEKCQSLDKRVQVGHCQTYGAPAYRTAPYTLPLVQGMQGTSMLI